MSPILSEDSANLCEEIAEETRAELGLGARSQVDPKALAALLEIEVESLVDFAGRCPEEVAQLTEDDPTALSAVTFFRGTRCMIIVNAEHPEHPEQESIEHELAHVLLEHQPKQLFDNCGLRIWHDCDEAQADYLACALAVPAGELRHMHVVLEGDVVALAEHFDTDLAIIAERLGRLVAAGGAAPKATLGESETPKPALTRIPTKLPPAANGGRPEPAGAPAA